MKEKGNPLKRGRGKPKKSPVKNNKIQDCYIYSILKPEGDILSQL